MADGTASGRSGNRELRDLHILHIADAEVVARWGPMLRHVLRVLAGSGPRLSLVTDEPDLSSSLAGSGAECHGLEHVAKWWGWSLSRLLTARFSPPPTIVHLWGTAALSAAQRWAKRAGVPVVVHALGEHDVRVLDRPGVHVCRRIAVTAGILGGPLVQETANPTAPAGAGVADAPTGPSVAGVRTGPNVTAGWMVIPPAVALPLKAGRRATDGRTLGVLCVHPLEDVAGIGVLLDALTHIRRDQADIQAVIVGSGSAAEVWHLARARGVNDRCVVLDEAKLWEKGLPGADVCVVPARRPSLALPPLLAMGLGVLVIASRDQAADWYVEGRTAWQFTPGSGVELAYLFTRVLEQPQQVAATTASAAEYFNRRHAVGELVERLIAVYRTVARDARAAGHEPGRDANGSE